jgi:ABC-type Fe3+-hydroxamate transport system substrate-binding protein
MENRFLKIEDNPDFVKDRETNAILNTNLAAVAEYKAKKKQAAKIISMEQEINMLKEELEKIKTHLKLS